MHNDPTRTTPLGLIRYAHDIYDSARALKDQLGKETRFELVSPMPSMYLIGHSIELALKAYLLNHQLTLKELRSKVYGHDLAACENKAKELGLVELLIITPAESAAIEMLHYLYSTKQLEYIVTGTKSMPLFELFESYARKLIRAVSQDVGYNRFNR